MFGAGAVAAEVAGIAFESSIASSFFGVTGALATDAGGVEVFGDNAIGISDTVFAGESGDGGGDGAVVDALAVNSGGTVDAVDSGVGNEAGLGIVADALAESDGDIAAVVGEGVD